MAPFCLAEGSTASRTYKCSKQVRTRAQPADGSRFHASTRLFSGQRTTRPTRNVCASGRNWPESIRSKSISRSSI